MGCKQAEACQNNKKNNFMGDWFSWQCHPGERYKVESFKNNFVEPSHSQNNLSDNLPRDHRYAVNAAKQNIVEAS